MQFVLRAVSPSLNRLRHSIHSSSMLSVKELQEAVTEQGAVVRKLKESKASADELATAIAELKLRKTTFEDAENFQAVSGPPKVNKQKFENCMKRRFFYGPSFSLYGGVAGLYDYGPAGCAMKANMVNYWRNHFVVEENMLEVECSMLTPEYVLKASGHVDRFCDFMVKDVKTGDCYRADHLLEAHLEKLIEAKGTSAEKKEEMESVLRQIDNYGLKEIGEYMKLYNCKAPLTNNELTDPAEFNLMFPTTIGPTGMLKGFMRPETAQGIFVNFKRLLEYNQDKMPFAGAQIGQAFRNEIAPRSGLIRVREFCQAEVEHFMDPSDKSHPKFKNVKDQLIKFYSSVAQTSGLPVVEMSVGKALEQGIIQSETMGYFLARIHQYLRAVGIPHINLRFRQHMPNEMAHYACDCWDAECMTSYGWVEIVGCADRSCFDLNAHAKATSTKLVAQKRLEVPVTCDVVEVTVNKAVLGKAFKKDSAAVVTLLNDLSEEDKLIMKEKLENGDTYKITNSDSSYEITKDMVNVKKVSKTSHIREYVPGVIEPSFGIGRILYCVLETNFKVREADEKRTWLDLPPLIAPTKCSVLPLSTNADFVPYVEKLSAELRQLGIPNKVDDSSGAIGRRYARTDEIGIPFGITVDFDTIKLDTVTVRERNSCSQVRVPMSDIGSLIQKLCDDKLTWAGAKELYPEFTSQETI